VAYKKGETYLFQISLTGTSKSNLILSLIPFKKPTQLTTQSTGGVPYDATSVHRDGCAEK